MFIYILKKITHVKKLNRLDPNLDSLNRFAPVFKSKKCKYIF